MVTRSPSTFSEKGDWQNANNPERVGPERWGSPRSKAQVLAGLLWTFPQSGGEEGGGGGGATKPPFHISQLHKPRSVLELLVIGASTRNVASHSEHYLPSQ